MKIGIVCGKIVSTRKTDRLIGYKILVVRPIDLLDASIQGRPFTALDGVGAGEGDVVMCVAGSSARQTDSTKSCPVDDLIVAILDSVDVYGRRIYDKADASLTDFTER